MTASRSARNHLLALGATVGIGPRRVDEVLASVGLTEVAHKSAGSFSLGMGQRLGIAAALLADPAVLILDEPVNGLDLDGIQWIRALLTELAQEGRTVLLSSHLMSEMQLVADHLLIIGQGRILADTSMDDFIEHASGGGVVVASPDAGALAPLLAADGVTLTSTEAGRFEVHGLTADEIGDIAAGHGLRLHELAPIAASLESAYLELTRDSVEYAAAASNPTSHPPTNPRGQPHDHRATPPPRSSRRLAAPSRRQPPTVRPWAGRSARNGSSSAPCAAPGSAWAAVVSAGRPGRDRGRRVHRLGHDSEDGGGFGNSDPLSTVLTGADFAVLLVGVLGALAGAREYGSRMISATIAAVPRRWQVVVSKVVVLTGVVLPTALIGVLAAFGVGMAHPLGR